MDVVQHRQIHSHKRPSESDLGEIFEKLDGGNDGGVRYVLDVANSLGRVQGRDESSVPNLGEFKVAGLRNVVWEAVKMRWRGR